MASPMCATCLTQDRWLKPLQAFVPEKYATSWMKYGISPETLVCWECEANILRVARFTAQVVRAQAMLQNLQNHQKQKVQKTVLTLNSMSKLALRPTIQVNTDHNDNDCPILSDDEHTNITRNQNNSTLPSQETSQVTRNFENSQKKPLYFINRYSQIASKVQPSIKVKSFAANTSETSNASNLQNSVSDGDHFIFVPENYGDTSNLVALVPGERLLSNSAIIGVRNPTPELNMSDLIHEIKTDYDIAEDTLVTVNMNKIGDGIKIDNVMSLNPHSNTCLDKHNITPVVAYNINVTKPNNVNQNRHKMNEAVEQDVKCNVFTLTETPVAVISNPNPSNVSENTLDFEDNIPVTKIISEDSLRTPNQKQKPQVLVEAVHTITKPKVTEMYKENDIIWDKQPDKSDKNKNDNAEKQHTVYSKSFESYVANVLHTPIPPTLKPVVITNKNYRPKPKSQAQERVLDFDEQSNYFIKLLNYTQVTEQRELNRQHTTYKRKQYKCVTCIEGWTREFDYKSHMERLHTLTSENLFMCDICSCRFNKRNEANDHFNKHFNVLACRFCNFAHYDLQEVKQHQCECKQKPNKRNMNPSVRTGTPPPPFVLDTDLLPKCPYCEGFFPDMIDIERHKPQCHANVEWEHNIDLFGDDDVTITKNNQRVDNVVEIMDDSDSASVSNDLLVPRKKKKNANPKKIVSAAVQNCVHCGRIIFKSDMEAHMKRRHPELIRLKANFTKT